MRMRMKVGSKGRNGGREGLQIQEDGTRYIT